MRYSDEYLGIKKIAVIESIAEMISKNKDCWDADLEKIVNTRATEIIDEIGTVLTSGKTDKQAVEEIRHIFDKYNISHKKTLVE